MILIFTSLIVASCTINDGWLLHVLCRIYTPPPQMIVAFLLFFVDKHQHFRYGNESRSQGRSVANIVACAVDCWLFCRSAAVYHNKNEHSDPPPSPLPRSRPTANPILNLPYRFDCYMFESVFIALAMFVRLIVDCSSAFDRSFSEHNLPSSYQDRGPPCDRIDQ